MRQDDCGRSVNGRTITPQSVTDDLVEDAICRVEQWRDRDVAYAPVGGGLSNSNWQIVVDGLSQQFFMKIPGAGSEAFVDRLSASQASRQAADIGIAPEFFWFEKASGIEVIEFLPDYRACTNSDLKKNSILDEIIDLYKELHTSSPLGLTKTMFDMIDEHYVQACDLNAHLPKYFEIMLREYKAAKSAMVSSGLDLVPCHNDPMPGNFLVSEGKPMKLVDYEYASNNERAYEVALIATEMFFDEENLIRFTEAFYGSASKQAISRVHVCSALADIKWGLWGCIKKQLTKGEWDFDYQKYGLWKLMRARGKMLDIRWGEWMASV